MPALAETPAERGVNGAGMLEAHARVKAGPGASADVHAAIDDSRISTMAVLARYGVLVSMVALSVRCFVPVRECGQCLKSEMQLALESGPSIYLSYLQRRTLNIMIEEIK